MAIYTIRQPNGEDKSMHPEIGIWYCGFFADHYGPGQDADGEIAQYVGDGQFYDEVAEEPTDMNKYDYLIAQN